MVTIVGTQANVTLSNFLQKITVDMICCDKVQNLRILSFSNKCILGMKQVPPKLLFQHILVYHMIGRQMCSDVLCGLFNYRVVQKSSISAFFCNNFH